MTSLCPACHRPGEPDPTVEGRRYCPSCDACYEQAERPTLPERKDLA